MLITPSAHPKQRNNVTVTWHVILDDDDDYRGGCGCRGAATSSRGGGNIPPTSPLACENNIPFVGGGCTIYMERREYGEP